MRKGNICNIGGQTSIENVEEYTNGCALSLGTQKEYKTLIHLRDFRTYTISVREYFYEQCTGGR